jgi:hypothetical protein
MINIPHVVFERFTEALCYAASLDKVELISAGNSSQKAGDNNAPQDRVEKQREADATEGEYPPPKLERTKTITAVYQRLIIDKASLSQLRSYHPPIPAGRHASTVSFCFLLPQTLGFATFIEDSHDLDK